MNIACPGSSPSKIFQQRNLMKKIMLAALLTSLIAIQMSGQTATPAVTKKQSQQQKRIVQGVNSGELTPQETQKLEQQQAKIQQDKKESKADGVVTPAEKTKLRREQKKASHSIHHQKHDAQAMPQK